MKNKALTFTQHESFSGIILFFSAVIGLMLANSAYQDIYKAVLYKYHLQFIVNDGLLTVFFLLIGLEIRREFLAGEIDTASKIGLPFLAALFGMIVPALVYMLVNFHHKEWWKGWAIPTATDIAFALGVFSLLGKRIPSSLKSLLMMIAIFDDIGAIIIIAVFYTHHLALGYLLFICGTLIFLKKANAYMESLWVYLLFSLLLWFCLLKAGLHPTLTGVLLAFIIPKNTIKKCENIFHPWSSYIILPLFAIANSNVPFLHHASLHLLSGISLGIILGLFLGKQLGIFFTILVSIKTGICRLPKHANYRLLYGISLLCGIGFTMSLFIGDLAFGSESASTSLMYTLRAAVMLGSLLSGLGGYALLRISKN